MISGFGVMWDIVWSQHKEKGCNHDWSS